MVFSQFFRGGKASEGTVCTRIGRDIWDWDVLQNGQVKRGRKLSDAGCRGGRGCESLQPTRRVLVEFNRFEGLKLVHFDVHNFILCQRREGAILTSRSIWALPFSYSTALDLIITTVAIICGPMV